MELKTEMTDNQKGNTGNAGNDGPAVAHPTSENVIKTGGLPPVPDTEKVVPHDRESEVTLSIKQEKLVCPQCGKLTLHAEFPDHYEAWIKCSSCGFFMGMSNEDWHRMENSSGINGQIKKMAIKKGLKISPITSSG